MGGNEFIDAAKNAILMYLKDPKLEAEDIQILWVYRTLQHCRGAFMTHLDNSMVFELTYNGDEDEIHMNVFRIVDEAYVVRADKVGDIVEEG